MQRWCWIIGEMRRLRYIRLPFGMGRVLELWCDWGREGDVGRVDLAKKDRDSFGS
jgi:hypothetical protein